MRPAHLSGIESQLLGYFVEMDLKRVTRLRRAVSALGPARWFVGESAQALEFIARDVIRDRLQSTGVERARDAVAAVGAAIEKRFEVHRGDRTIFFHSGFDVHQDGMATAVTVENFFTSKSALHRPTRQHRKLANHN